VQDACREWAIAAPVYQEALLPRLLLPYRFFLGGPLGDGRQWLPWIHIADEVAAIRFLINNEGA